MRILSALILAPLLALLDQGVGFSMVGWSCAHGGIVALHALNLLCLAATAALAVLAGAEWRRTARAIAGVCDHFLYGVATAAASLSALAIVAMWLAVWMISPCIA